ncbi:DUF6544 family protein [Pseudaestuariivita atlantica]|uniref:DUF6544 family protein n=1 Tax=Pseudaestuariivita atlantica TaxID=1317121 RepID=UPI0009E34147|nr:DUF6544 family protein [Pseudaestuariivita atlantica]
MIGTLLIALLLIGGTALVGFRLSDHWRDHKEMTRLRALQPFDPEVFRAEIVADLPDAARRFFLFSIQEGTPLRTVVQLEMQGSFSLGSKADPKYMQMRAKQVLAAPDGFVWTMTAQSGHLKLSGSDSGSWTRFWLANVMPVARSGGTADHARSAFGRYVAEAVFWSPAALLPNANVFWSEVSGDIARVTVEYRGQSQSVDLTVGEDGRPTQVVFSRWTNANPESEFRLQPFGGTLAEFKSFDGFRLPTHIEAGNGFGTEDYFPFFIADVTSLSFPVP